MSFNDVKTIPEIIREIEQMDKNGETTYSEYVTESMREDINKTEAYINSKHISGDTDYLGREKPFFNIVMAARNVWYRATDIDRKDIKVRAEKQKDVVKAFLATLKLQEWMKTVNFGQFLNDWGLSLSTHGSTVAKFIEKNGELSAQVMDWNNLLCDAIDFDGNVKIEKLYYTPSQLKQQKGYDQELVEELLKNTTKRETVDGQAKDNKDDYILVYELHGELPLSLLTDKDEDEDDFVQQMHVVSLSDSKEVSKSDDAGESYTLYSGRESKDPYMITHLIKKDGQTYSGGAVKNLFEAQWMVNDSQKQIKDQLELASKIVFQTSDGAFAGKNALTNIENGDILVYKTNEPLTRLAGTPDIVAMQSFKADWQNVAMQINGINEAMIQAPKSGTAWRQTQAVLQEAHSLFELMTENKGLAIIKMLREYVIPHFKKKLKDSKEISMTLEDYQIKQIDSMYVPNEITRRMNEKKKAIILSGEIYDPTLEEGLIAKTEEEIRANLTGNQRFIKPDEIESKTWKEVLKDMEMELEVDVTGEVRDVQGALATLTTVLQTIAVNPQALLDPNFKMIFNKIISLTGNISPLEMQQAQEAPQPMIQQPNQQPIPQMQ